MLVEVLQTPQTSGSVLQLYIFFLQFQGVVSRLFSGVRYGQREVRQRSGAWWSSDGVSATGMMV